MYKIFHQHKIPITANESMIIILPGNRATEVKPVPTASPTEITKSTTTSTHAPETTTPPSTTTTTTTPSTTTSTEAPKTTTSSPTPITTKAPPTPVPEPPASTWNITDKNNVIIAHMAVQFSITYNVTDEKIKVCRILIYERLDYKKAYIFLMISVSEQNGIDKYSTS